MTDPRTRVVLFADISGSSRLYQELGDTLALGRVRTCLDSVRRVVEAHGGRVIKAMGDGMMCDFAEADHAILAAHAMQSASEDADGDSGPRLALRVGCHLGPVIEQAGDLFGDTVNLGARVVEVARAGQIIATRPVVDHLSALLRTSVRPIGDVGVKGRSEKTAVLEYIWRHGEMTIASAPAAGRAAVRRLKLAFGGQEVWLDSSRAGAVRLGRAPECDITINDREASRQHATIEVRGDNFVLVDHSSNGTYVDWGMVETLLKRQEMILPERGRIALGLSTASPQATLVEFTRQ